MLKGEGRQEGGDNIGRLLLYQSFSPFIRSSQPEVAVDAVCRTALQLTRGLCSSVSVVNCPANSRCARNAPSTIPSLATDARAQFQWFRARFSTGRRLACALSTGLPARTGNGREPRYFPPKGGAPSIPSGASSPINRNIQSNLHKAARNVGSLAGGLGRPPGGCVPKGTEAAPWRCLPSLRGSNTTMGGPCYSSRVMKLRSFLGNRRT